jgi:hypothetical protein
MSNEYVFSNIGIIQNVKRKHQERAAFLLVFSNLNKLSAGKEFWKKYCQE